MNNDERKEELGFVATIITNICNEYDICLFAKELKNGQLAVLMHDNKTNNDYAIVKEDNLK